MRALKGTFLAGVWYCILSLGTSTVQAALIDYSFTFTTQTTGFVGLADIDPDDLAVGDKFQISFTANSLSLATGSDGTSSADFDDNPLTNFSVARLSGTGSYTPTFTEYSSYVGTYDYAHGHLTFGFYLTGGNSVGWTSNSSSGAMAIQSIFLNFNSNVPVAGGFGSTPPLSLFLNAPQTDWTSTGGSLNFQGSSMSLPAQGPLSVPEPSNLVLLGLAAFGGYRVRRKRA